MQNLGYNALIAAIVLPLFYLSVFADRALCRRQGRDDYDDADTVASLAVSLLMSGLGILTLVLRVAIYALVFRYLALYDWSTLGAWSWLLGLLLYDFTYYWQHLMGHEWHLLWASHVVHHSSERFNLATALRVPAASMNLWTWLFALPLAVLGVPPTVYAVASLLNLLYQFWIHTERVGEMGWFDRWFGSPSNHRVHHGVNARYLDRNYGGILMCWDRLFGTFETERADDPVRYGTRAQVRSFNPIWINLHTPLQLLRELRALPDWRQRLALLFHRPGWQPDHAGPLAAAALPAWQAPPRYAPPLPQAWVQHGLWQCFISWPLLVQLLAMAPQMDWPNKIAFGLWLSWTAGSLGLLLHERPHHRTLGVVLEAHRLLLAGGLALTGHWFAPWPYDLPLDLPLAVLMFGSLISLGWRGRQASRDISYPPDARATVGSSRAVQDR